MTDQPNPPDLDLEVNIPVPSGLYVTADSPYRFLFVGCMAGSGSVSGPLNDGIVAVTSDTFDEVMQAACPSVNFTTTDPLASGNQMVAIELSFDSLKSFDPRNLVTRIPMTKTLASIREKLTERVQGKISDDAMRAAVLQAVTEDASLSWIDDSLKWSPAPVEAEPEAVDGLLGQLDLGDDAAASPPTKSPIGKMVSATAQGGGSVPSEEASSIRRTIGEVDRRLSTWLTTVLHAPQIQSIEAAWRSLAFLVKQFDFRKGVRLSLLHAAPGEMLERFRTRVIDPVFDEGADAPDVVLLDRQFSSSSSDMEELDEWAQHAASLPAAVLTGASSQFFGVKHGWQIKTLPVIPTLMDQWQFAKWKSLMGKPYARSLGVIFGRCLLRAPCGRSDVGDFDFAYVEPCITDRDLVWAGGATVMATTIARSMAETGWPCGVSGMMHGRVEGFTTAVGGKKGDKTFGPSDTPLAQSKIEEMGMAGVNAVVGVPDSDAVLVCNGMTAARAPRGDVNAVFEVSLPYRLFASRLSALLFALKPHLAGMATEKVEPFVKQHICDWLPFGAGPSAEQLSIQVRKAEDNPAVREMAVTVTAPQNILPGGVPVVMGYRLD